MTDNILLVECINKLAEYKFKLDQLPDNDFEKSVSVKRTIRSDVKFLYTLMCKIECLDNDIITTLILKWFPFVDIY